MKNETFINFTDYNVDGNGTNITTLARIQGPETITIGSKILDRVENAIANYKNENEGEWDTDGCLEAAEKQLKSEGYTVEFLHPFEICF